MNAVLYYLNAGLLLVAFAAIVWWMYVQLTNANANAQRELEQTTRRAAIQPWGDDKPGGRGNR